MKVEPEALAAEADELFDNWSFFAGNDAVVATTSEVSDASQIFELMNIRGYNPRFVGDKTISFGKR